ncbi:DUF262 domain-containing protein [uncultured Methanoregula sp.]|uniref:DUF262 domain-containing protein n=1 Tax=uncultured Methanoregula sp. TaxID=1005933 RepID=UPI002AAB4E62|nr:DUF262 domain-containing protein [uncultured Methanoregula sp.]
MKNNNITRIYSEREFLESDPVYQRDSDIWDEPKKQLFIDSILNDYDIPKLYFNSHLSPRSNSKGQEKKGYEYSIIDGKQRLEAIWGFINGDFNLSKDFIYFVDESIKAGNLSYDELGKKYPRLRNKFDSTNLPIIEVESDESDLIEDMFSRLNEAVPLNSAENRNAIGGPMAAVIRDVAKHHFFKQKVYFKDIRYRHREVAARLLFIEYYLVGKNQIFDTKKPLLDNFVKIFKKSKSISTNPIKEGVISNLLVLNEIFTDKDILLKSQSVIPIYYLVARELRGTLFERNMTRDNLQKFINAVSKNKEIATTEIGNADFDLLDYNQMSIQGTNDASSIKERTRILKEFLLKQ